MPIFKCPECNLDRAYRKGQTAPIECPNCGFNTTKRKTNIERITEYMESNPLNQAFVMSAVSKMSEHCISNFSETKKAMEKNGSASLISPEAWLQCAKDFKEKYPEYFS